VNLAAVLAFCGLESVPASIELQDICLDSREIKFGDLFVALPGIKTDGKEFIQQAIANGAAAVMVSSPYAGPQLQSGIPIIHVADLKSKMAALAAYFYQDPARNLKMIGVTGTNGKTSCTHYIAQILSAADLKCGVMGTVGNGLLSNLSPSALTSSDCCTMQKLFSQLRDLEAKYVAMEVSSHALDQGRMQGLDFECAVFSNLSQDHLDYHHGMEEYFSAKARLFTEFNPKHAIINLDDLYGERLLHMLAENKNINVVSYSLNNPKADVYLFNNKIYTPRGVGILQSSLLGSFNLSNVLACIACCKTQGLSLDQILIAVKNLTAVTGRMQKVPTVRDNEPLVVVDYAHTPDAIAKALQALREHTEGKLYCIFGCGGDRDRSKRPLMLRAAIENSDQVVITQDNPRTEDPQQIVRDILADQTISAKISIEQDRASAISKTIFQAGNKDLILIAGKGHEDYQIIGLQKTPFSDLLVAKQALELRSENAWIV
jgi:UDP-N-acetylmuramoyl-L-alanyl-D-glutamate--2,6-diaminopimelate ligase